MDRRCVETLRDLRQRGFAADRSTCSTGSRRAGRAGADRLAQRIWRMEQQAIRFSLRELDIPVVAWDGSRAWTCRWPRTPAGPW